MRGGGAVEGGDEAPKKKQRVEVVIPSRPKKDAPRAAQKEGPEPDYLLALANINNSVVSLARAVEHPPRYHREVCRGYGGREVGFGRVGQQVRGVVVRGRGGGLQVEESCGKYLAGR